MDINGYRSEEAEVSKIRRHPAVITVRALAYSTNAFALIAETVRVFQGEPVGTKLFSPVIATLLLTGIWLAEKLSRLRLPPYLDIALTLFISGSLPFGSTYDFYNIVPGWDKAMHTLSGFVFFFSGLCIGDALAGKECPGKRRAVISVVTALLIALAVGYLWELFEYAGDSVLGMNNQRWENGFIGELPDGTFIVDDPRGNAIIDTMTDMLCNFCGALVCFVPSLIAFLKKPSLIDNFSLIRMPRA